MQYVSMGEVLTGSSYRELSPLLSVIVAEVALGGWVVGEGERVGSSLLSGQRSEGKAARDTGRQTGDTGAVP